MGENYQEFTHNGMTAKYHKGILDNPRSMERLAKELQEFCKIFFDVDVETWQGVMSPIDVYDAFSRFHYLTNDWVEKVKEVIDDANMMQEPVTLIQAIEQVNKRDDKHEK